MLLLTWIVIAVTFLLQGLAAFSAKINGTVLGIAWILSALLAFIVFALPSFIR